MNGDGRRRRPTSPPASQLHVDWQACRGRGLCHELLPELIDLDDWGYPVIVGPVPAHLLPHAGRAVRGCPRLALTLVDAASTTPRRTGGAASG